METIYKVEFNFDSYKNCELILESFIVISAIFTKCLQDSFSVSYPAIIDSEGYTNCMEVELTVKRPLIYEEYKKLSEALFKINWSCFVKDKINNITTVMRRDAFNNNGELTLGEVI